MRQAPIINGAGPDDLPDRLVHLPPRLQGPDERGQGQGPGLVPRLGPDRGSGARRTPWATPRSPPRSRRRRSPRSTRSRRVARRSGRDPPTLAPSGALGPERGSAAPSDAVLSGRSIHRDVCDPPGRRTLTRGSGQLSDRFFRTAPRRGTASSSCSSPSACCSAWNSRLTGRRSASAFITGTEWDPVKGIYGALPFIVGTLVASAHRHRLRRPDRDPDRDLPGRARPAPGGHAADLPRSSCWPRSRASSSACGASSSWPVPAGTRSRPGSPVFGWIPFFAGPTYGVGLFAAGVILTIMILPTIVADLARGHPGGPGQPARGDVRARRDALGGISRAVLPFARSGIIGAVILGLGRALGETMAVTMVIGNSDAIPTRLFDQAPDDRLARSRRRSTRRASASSTSSLIALGLVLLVMTIILNIVARLLVRRVAGPVGGDVTARRRDAPSIAGPPRAAPRGPPPRRAVDRIMRDGAWSRPRARASSRSRPSSSS